MKLVVLEGNVVGSEYRLGSRALVIGREASCDLTIDDVDVSREHCRISTAIDGVLIEDLGSRNGTIVNGLRIASPTPLQPGDLVVVGSLLLEVRSDTPRPALQAPAPARAAARPDHERPRSKLATRPRPLPRAGIVARSTPKRERENAATRAATAAERVQTLADELLSVPLPRPSARLATAVGRAERVCSSDEAQRLMALCKSVQRLPEPRRRGEALAAQASAVRRLVSATRQLLVDLRSS